jgi:hypothetical protein
MFEIRRVKYNHILVIIIIIIIIIIIMIIIYLFIYLFKLQMGFWPVTVVLQ